ncbi:hypothetical protein D9611_011461 [Ephemerocybe angulata]|uniref:Nephrocystin 3-like N-terminal domain-containing protein n=1 Tax=Ephemerocybe angulata TaxID=980116 RepID=A0A8H5CFJ4_9AGAR|nr:hypothetical protein D9611_011461 [Tulosesus angulatus]
MLIPRLPMSMQHLDPRPVRFPHRTSSIGSDARTFSNSPPYTLERAALAASHFPEGEYSPPNSENRHIAQVHNYYGTVNNVDNIGNANMGQNLGIIGQLAGEQGYPSERRGSESPSTELLRVFGKNIASAAAHDSYVRCNAPRCVQGTRVEVLEEILSWISEPYKGMSASGADKILWVTGPVGTGKTAVLGSIAEACKKNEKLAASFFFSPFSADRRCLIATLASQFFEHKNLRGIQVLMLSAMRHSPLALTKNLKQQFDTLILGPLLELKQRGGLSATTPPLILIDGLEECVSGPLQDTYTPTMGHGSPLAPAGPQVDDQREILSFILHAVNNPLLPFRAVIASRPERAIRGFFVTEGKAITHQLILDNKYNPDADISRFYDMGFSTICDSSKLPPDWPGAEKKQILVNYASGRFICAAKVMHFIEGASLSKKAGRSAAGRSARLSTPSQRHERLLNLLLSPSPLSSLKIRTVLGASRDTADDLYEKGTEAWHRYEASRKDADLAKAVGYYQQAQVLRAERDMDETIEKLHGKGVTAWSQFIATEDKNANSLLLTKAIDFYNQALARAKGGHPFRQTILLDLIFAFLAVEPLSREHVPLIESYFAEVAGRNPSKLQRDQGYAITTALGKYFESQYISSSAPGDFDRCVAYYQNSARLYSPNPEAQIERFLAVAELHIGRREDAHFEKALNAYLGAKGLCRDTAEWDPMRLKISRGMYEVHKRRYLKREYKADLESAIAECGHAISLDPPPGDRIQLLTDFVRCVWVLLDAHGTDPVDSGNKMKRAASYGRKVLELLSDTPDGDEIKHEVIVTLANILSSAKGGSRTQDLDEALYLYDRAHVYTPKDADLLSMKAEAIWLRCKKTCVFLELQEAADLYIEALEETVDSLVKSNIANNIGAIYLDKANDEDVEELKQARNYYLMAAKWCNDADRDGFARWDTKPTPLKRSLGSFKLRFPSPLAMGGTTLSSPENTGAVGRFVRGPSAVRGPQFALPNNGQSGWNSSPEPQPRPHERQNKRRRPQEASEGEKEEGLESEPLFLFRRRWEGGGGMRSDGQGRGAVQCASIIV